MFNSKIHTGVACSHMKQLEDGKTKCIIREFSKGQGIFLEDLARREQYRMKGNVKNLSIQFHYFV